MTICYTSGKQQIHKSSFRKDAWRTSIALVVLGLMACDDQSNIEGDLPMTDGPAIYQENCSVCHGTNGEGGSGKALTSDHINEMTDAQLFMSIYNGIGGVMPAFQSTLTSEEITALVEYIREL